ncbi:hypothetical protein VTN31DRAFT_1189 [Thermomyces dupontii]|uniref:uncharacterized protein n=1 Tax=Talaromyces thermophilus TaxID=28565 RepID=UPI003742A83E
MERYFSPLEQQYPTEQSKVNSAVYRIGGDFESAWNSRNPDVHTWAEFKRWLRDQVEDPRNRLFNAVVELRDGLFQKDHENQTAFLTRFEEVYNKFNDEERSDTWEQRKTLYYYACLQPWLRKDLYRAERLPLRIADMVALAERYWKSTLDGAKKQSELRKRKFSDRDRGTGSGNGPSGNRDRKPDQHGQTDPRKRRDDKSSPTRQSPRDGPRCYACNRFRHLARSCRTLKKQEQSKTGSGSGDSSA